jgi:hypothetical protein
MLLVLVEPPFVRHDTILADPVDVSTKPAIVKGVDTST